MTPGRATRGPTTSTRCRCTCPRSRPSRPTRRPSTDRLPSLSLCLSAITFFYRPELEQIKNRSVCASASALAFCGLAGLIYTGHFLYTTPFNHKYKYLSDLKFISKYKYSYE
uniref:Uncharacterized protein n=1 Tax=Arundo donax TaxID=35708 RepID=A0A0A9DS25_ARUDO